MASTKEFLVWDFLSVPPTSNDTCLVLWRQYADCYRGAISIPQYIDQNPKQIRSEYLEYIFKLSRLEHHGMPIGELLQIREGLSFWWLSLLQEKCNYAKSPLIEDAIRLIAFDICISETPPTSLKLASRNVRLAQSLSQWCKQRSIAFYWTCSEVRFISKIYYASRFPYIIPIIGAFAYYLRFIMRHWALIPVSHQTPLDGMPDIHFFSYLPHFSPDLPLQPDFDTIYWGTLPAFLSRNNIKSRWTYLFSGKPPTNHDILKLNSTFRQDSSFQARALLANYVSFRVLLTSLTDWLRIFLGSLPVTITLRTSSLHRNYLWPLFADNWFDSIAGISCISNCIYLALLESFFSSLPYQRIGFYLQENISWELILNYLWRKGGHGALIGVSHSTVRFWDLRYYNDPLVYDIESLCPLPAPDFVALNGPLAISQFRAAKYPSSRILEVEALRYLYLSDNLPLIAKKKSHDPPLNILVLGDYSATTSYALIQLVVRAVPLLSSKPVIDFKPHPLCSIDLSLYSVINLASPTAPLLHLLSDADLVISSTTSASVEAYLLGKRVIFYSDPCHLNLSPLVSFSSSAAFVNSPQQLANTIESSPASKSLSLTPEPMFFLERHLPRWHSLLL